MKKPIEKLEPTTLGNRIGTPEPLLDKLNEIIDRLNSLDNESLQKPEEEWPKEGDEFWHVNEDGRVFKSYFNEPLWGWAKRFGNIFHTEKEAEEARDAIRELLLSLKK